MSFAVTVNSHELKRNSVDETIPKVKFLGVVVVNTRQTWNGTWRVIFFLNTKTKAFIAIFLITRPREVYFLLQLVWQQGNVKAEPSKSYSKLTWKYIHIQVKHAIITFDCSHCELNTKVKQTLKRHIKSTHENIRFDCNCSECRTTPKQNLKTHIQAKLFSL